MNVLLKWSVIGLLSATMWAQTAGSTSTPQSGSQQSVTAEDVKSLREALAAAQQQIRELQHDMQSRDQDVQKLAEQLHPSANDTRFQLTAMQTPGDQQKNSELAERIDKLEHPTTIHFKGITLTPGGFLEAAGVARTRNENASVNSAAGDFNIPLSGTPNAHLSEFRFDARQSRLSLLGEGKIHGAKVTGYYEVDFLGAAPTANENQSNSFNLRQRQVWASVDTHGLTFTGGQQFSLFTLNRKGMANRTEFLPMVINAQYVIGYDWARQPSFRVVKNFHDRAWAGFAVENSSTINPAGQLPTTTINGAPIYGFANSANAQSPNGNFTLSNTPGANGVSTNVAPDLVAKLTFEPGWGHFEIKGLGRFFRDRVAGETNTKFGGGVGAGVILPIVPKMVDLVGEATVGNGIGRYGSGGGIDLTLKPNGDLSLIRSYHVLVGPEVHIGSKLDLYAYVGEEYYARQFYTVSGATTVGYGSNTQNNAGCVEEQINSTAPPSCPNNTRYALEGTPGFWYRFYKGSAGIVQVGAQYSYSTRSLWQDKNGFSPKGIENQFYTSFRYVLP